jgi:hypothetical protein
MAWQVSGRSLELCNCNLLCPCWFGPDGKPDQGWCGGAFAFDIQRGSSDGVDLSGTKVALAFSWPGNFFGGNGTARCYVGDDAKPDQRSQLEAIFTGKKGGLLAPLWQAVVKDWLPTEMTSVKFGWGDSPSLTVGNVAHVTLAPLKDQAGRPTKVEGAAAQAAFQLGSMDVASSKGSRWTDPQLRAWEGDSGTIHQFNWTA